MDPWTYGPSGPMDPKVREYNLRLYIYLVPLEGQHVA